MGLILAGILLCVLIIGLAFLLLSKGIVSSFGSELLFLLAAVCLIAGAFAGITAPVNGYGKHEIVSTTELVSLRDDTFVKIISKDNFAGTGSHPDSHKLPKSVVFSVYTFCFVYCN